MGLNEIDLISFLYTFSYPLFPTYRAYIMLVLTKVILSNQILEDLRTIGDFK